MFLTLPLCLFFQNAVGSGPSLHPAISGGVVGGDGMADNDNYEDDDININDPDNDDEDDLVHAQTAVFQILEPAHSRSLHQQQQQQQQQQFSEEEPDSQLSRQSSVEEGGGSGRSRRRSSGGKSSAIKSRIQMRRMMKEANRLEVPAGGRLSDAEQDTTEDVESVEEKQDSESVLDDEIRNSKKKKKYGGGGFSADTHTTGHSFAAKQPPTTMTAQLTPETARRMRDWNSRFYNLKNSFDTTSDKEEDASRSPSVHRQLPDLLLHQEDGGGRGDGEGGDRGRARFKDKGPGGQKRAQSAHGSLLSRTGGGFNSRPNIMVDQSPSLERPQSKDDKNKNNAIIAHNNGRMFPEAMTPKVNALFLSFRYLQFKEGKFSGGLKPETLQADFEENNNTKARHERNVFTCKDEEGPWKLNAISRKGPGETTASILLLIALKDRVHYHNINKICS